MICSTEDSRRVAVDPPKELSGRICAVCSDRANGYNFGVLTCESCKAFFRRNAAKRRDIKCPFSNSCQITSASRKFCQSCRLQKCLAVGMNSDWLDYEKNRDKSKYSRSKRKITTDLVVGHSNPIAVDDNDNIRVSKAFLENLMKQAKQRQSATNACSCTCTCGFYPYGTKLTALSLSLSPHDGGYASSSVNSPLSSSSLMGQSPANTNSPHIFHLQNSPIPLSPQGIPIVQHTSSFSIPSVTPQTFTTPNSQNPNIWSNTSQNYPTQIRNDFETSAFHPIGSVSVKFGEMSLQIRKKIMKYSSVLTKCELEMLEELHILNEPLTHPLEKNYNQESLQDVVHIVEEALRRIISMAAGLKAFQDLDIEDRKQLIKSGFCELLIVRGVMAYNKTNESWNHSNTNVKMEILKRDPKSVNHYEMHKRLLDSFGDEIRMNDNIMLLFNAIVIFHPHVSNLKESSKVHQTQAKYFAILLKILNFEFSPQLANDYYAKLLELGVELHRVNQTMLHVFYGLDPSSLDPLVKELCNFN